MNTILEFMNSYTNIVTIAVILTIIYYYILFKKTSEDSKRVYLYENAKPKVIDEDILFIYFVTVLVTSNAIVLFAGMYSDIRIIYIFDSLIGSSTIMILPLLVITNLGTSLLIFLHFLRRDSKLILKLIKKYKIERIVVLDHVMLSIIISTMGYLIYIVLKVLFIGNM